MDHCPFCKSKNIRIISRKDANAEFLEQIKDSLSSLELETLKTQLDMIKGKNKQLDEFLFGDRLILFCENCGEEFDTTRDFSYLENKMPTLISYEEYEELLKEYIKDPRMLDLYLTKARKYPSHYVEQVESILKSQSDAIRMVDELKVKHEIKKDEKDKLVN